MDDKRYFYKHLTAAALMMTLVTGCNEQYAFTPNVADQLDAVQVDPTTSPPVVVVTTAPPTIPPVVIVTTTPPPSSLYEDVVQEISVPLDRTRPADIVFVIDNSGSMSDEQQKVAASFNKFISQFHVRDIDYHIGVMTTDISSMQSAREISSWKSKMSGFKRYGPGCLTSRYDEAYLTKNSPDLVNRFNNNAKVGLRGAGDETGLGAISRAIDPAKFAVGGCNEGFLRAGSVLSVIYVSDEDDTLVGRAECAGLSILDCGQKVSQSLKSAVSGQDAEVRQYAIVDLKARAPSKPLKRPITTGFFAYPEVFRTLSQPLAIPLFSIVEDFGVAIQQQIASSILKAAENRTFSLNKRPSDLTKLKVSLNGELLIRGDANGFVYDDAANLIELRGLALAESAGKRLVIEFTALK